MKSLQPLEAAEPRPNESPPNKCAPDLAVIGSLQGIGAKILAALNCAEDKFPPSIEMVQTWNAEARRLAGEFCRAENWNHFRGLLLHVLGMWLRLRGRDMSLDARSLRYVRA